MSLSAKLEKIKVVFTDVDGVLTDGGLYYTDEGHVMKKFNVRDGIGSIQLQKNGFKVGILSTDDSELIKKRAERLNLDYLYYSVKDKKKIIKKICEASNINFKNIAFIGDDINDLEALNAVGFSAAPADAVEEVKKIVDYICKYTGGEGAFREFADLLINHKNQKGN